MAKKLKKVADPIKVDTTKQIKKYIKESSKPKATKPIVGLRLPKNTSELHQRLIQ